MSVKIRTKKLADGRLSLYLDIYSKGKRAYETLNLYLGRSTKANRETMDLAEVICAQRQAEISVAGFGLPLPHRMGANFIDYFTEASLQRGESTRKLWQITLGHLKTYTKNHP